ncbi:NIPSNAP family protein [Aquibacillus koreensis]|uniref:NIPSNAP family protein n=1 Tax=Aquibacillus koreensis TaxID=279446 RepID=A0A9X3WNK1_9BACI|nr:NIPSNAP family protein [Aquibacillus koreensis]MCT2536212.1 NIPSNAP family protein [Aquibacillus koreensis]MDC3422023.1 NIPSNAP family protein [Aquibacillus koreensis]
MIYRIRTYKIDPTKYNTFTDFFHKYLLPNQKTFGSKLIGRWVNEKQNQIMAIWEYESKEHYEEIEKKIKKTPLHLVAQKRKEDLGNLYIETTQTFWNSKGNYN